MIKILEGLSCSLQQDLLDASHFVFILLCSVVVDGSWRSLISAVRFGVKECWIESAVTTYST